MIDQSLKIHIRIYKKFEQKCFTFVIFITLKTFVVNYIVDSRKIIKPGYTNLKCQAQPLYHKGFATEPYGLLVPVMYYRPVINLFLETTYLKFRFLKEKWTSTIPVVLTLVLKMSCSVGWYSLAPSLSRSSKKLKWNKDKLDSHICFYSLEIG